MSLGIAIAVIGAVSALAVTRSGVPASAMRLLTGDAWLENASAGTVTHVNGYSGDSDAQATVGKAGDPFEVVQRQGGAFVLDLKTGRLSRLDDSGLNVTTSATEPTPARALQVITGTKATWILDKSSGVLQQVNPTTLKPLGHQVALGGRTGTGVVDGSGSIWIPLLSKAGVDQVDPGGALSHHAFGRAGDAIELADTSAGVWAVDAHGKTVASLSTPTAHTVSLPALTKAPIIGASGSSPDLVLVSGSQVLNVDTAQPSLSSLALPAAAASVTQVAVSSGRAYLLDPHTHRLDTVNLSPMGITASTPVPSGANQLVDKDQLVFVNGTSSPQALVVNPNGGVTDVTKYNPRVPPQSNNQGHGISSSSNPTSSTVPKTPPAGTGPPASETPSTQPSFQGPPSSNQEPTPTVPPASTPPNLGPTTPAPTVPTRSLPPTTAPPSTTTPTTVPPSTTTSAPPGPPGVPTNIVVKPGNGQVSVSWSPPASDGGSPVTRYSVTGSPVNDPAITGATAILSNLTNGTPECVQVQAINAAGGGPLSPANVSCATPVAPAAPPNAPTGLSVSSGPGVLGISWTAATVAAGSPGVTGYQVTVGGTTHTTTATSVVVAVPAWTSESVTVRAVNSVGVGPPAPAQSGTAYARSGTVTCVDSLSGDHAYQNTCTNLGGAWSQVNSSPIGSWINAEGGAGGHTVSGLEGLCTTYTSGAQPGEVSGKAWSGDDYGLASSADNTACGKVQLYPQAPDYTHVIAAVSSTALPGGQHVCIYKGLTTGTNGQFTQDELAICGSAPAGMTNYSQIADFYT